jgi:hypothetical protein
MHITLSQPDFADREPAFYAFALTDAILSLTNPDNFPNLFNNIGCDIHISRLFGHKMRLLLDEEIKIY